MSKTKMLVAAVVALILLNVSLLVIGGIKKPRGNMKDRRPGIRQIVAQKLNFDEAQLASYEKLIKDHRSEVRQQENQIRNAKDNLYGNLSIDDQEVKQQMLLQINAAQLKIEQIHYDHFIDIKNLCKGDQLAQFNELQSGLGRLFKKGPPRKK